jgi:hypothetical protein
MAYQTVPQTSNADPRKTVPQRQNTSSGQLRLY